VYQVTGNEYMIHSRYITHL